MYVIDSGCSNYMIQDKDVFTSLDETHSEYGCPNKSSSKIQCSGTVEFFAQQKDGRKAKVMLHDALFIPENGQTWLSLAVGCNYAICRQR